MVVSLEVKLGLQYLLEKRKRACRRASFRVQSRKRRQMAFRRQQSQQRVLFVLMLCTCVTQLYAPERAMWTRERSSEWWESVVNNAFEPYDWTQFPHVEDNISLPV